MEAHAPEAGARCLKMAHDDRKEAVIAVREQDLWRPLMKRPVPVGHQSLTMLGYYTVSTVIVKDSLDTAGCFYFTTDIYINSMSQVIVSMKNFDRHYSEISKDGFR